MFQNDYRREIDGLRPSPAAVERLNRMLAENTKRPYEDVVKATERDNFLTPEEAKELGIIDRVLASRREMAQEKSE